VDGALDFDGQSQQVQVTQAVSSGALDFDADQSFTIDAWINPRSFLERTMPIVAKQDPQTGIGYRLFLRSGRLAFVMNDGAASAPAYFSSDPLWTDSSPPGWTCIAVTVKRADCPANAIGTVYVDDRQPETFPLSAGSLVNSGDLSIGGSPGEDFFHDRIDEVEIFARSVEQVTISQIYEADARGKCKPSEGEDAGAPEPWRLALLSSSSWSA